MMNKKKMGMYDVLNILAVCTVKAIKTVSPKALENPKVEDVFYKGVMSGIIGTISQMGLMEEMKKCDSCHDDCNKCNKRQANLYRTAYAYAMLNDEEREMVTSEVYSETKKIRKQMRKKSEEEEIKNTILKTGKFL